MVKKSDQGRITFDKEYGRIARKDGFISVRVVIREESEPTLDLRMHTYTPSGDIFPTSKGFTMFINHIPDLINMLKAVYEESQDPK